MPLQDVIFAFRRKRYERKFERELLSLGSIVWVITDQNDEAIEFSVDESPGATATRVTWIAPSEWAVFLGDGSEILPSLGRNITNAIGDLIADFDIEREIQRHRNRLKRTDFVSNNSATDEFIASPLHVIQTVVDRIDLCNRLNESDVQKALFHHHEPLIIYLCLTCFDRLGQPSAFVTFGDWLETKKKHIWEVREGVMVPRDATHSEIAKRYYAAYVKHYGVKASFFRFLQSVLSDDVRTELLSSFEIECLENPPSLAKRPPANDREKETFLYKLRNDYTHSVNFRGGTGSDIRTASATGTWRMGYYQEFRQSDWISVRVRNWPNIFRKSVRYGLASYIRNLSNNS